MNEARIARQKDRGKTSVAVLRKGALPSLAEMAFIILGFLIAIAGFYVLNSFIGGLVSREYDRIAEDTAKDITRNFSDIERSINTIAGVVYLSKNDAQAKHSENLRKFVSGLERFDQLIWVYKTEEGRWRFDTIYRRPDTFYGIRRYTLSGSQELLEQLNARRYFSANAPVVVTDLPFAATNSEEAGNTQNSAFAIIKAVQESDPASGIVIGVTSPATAVIGNAWLKDNGLVSQMTIRELSNGLGLYHMDRRQGAGENAFGAVQAYEFMLGGSKWELTADFTKENKVYVLEATPYVLAGFILIIMIGGAMYLRGSLRKSVEISLINKTLQRKNTELRQEISGREKLNEALAKAEKDNRAIIDSVSDIIFEMDTEGRILFVSARWPRITGFSEEQTLGVDLFKMIHPEDQDRLHADFTALLKGDGEQPAMRAFTRIRTSSGRFRAAELSISVMRRDENGGKRVVGTFTDIEERRRVERALGEAEKKYRAIVENAAGGIFQLTPEGIYLSANPAMARILGYSNPEGILREIKNANEDIYVAGRERQAFLKLIEKEGTVNNYETQVRRRDGTVIWVNENVRAVRDESSQTLYYEGSMEDISSRKKTEMALRSAIVQSDLANRAKSEFLANMSHELRTPLNAIIGFSDIIKNEAFGPVEPRAYWEYARDISDSGRSLLQVINEILDISRIEAGERQLNENLVDLRMVVSLCLNLLSNKIEGSNMHIINVIGDIPKIVGEELAIKQIVMNLLSNAVKFTPSGGRITLMAEKDNDGQLLFSVTDTGVGLDEAEIQKALSPFGQISNQLNRSNSGTGLGLTLVDALVKLHGGRLDLFSQKGIGTTVTVTFPASRVSIKTSGSAQQTGGKPENVKA